MRQTSCGIGNVDDVWRVSEDFEFNATVSRAHYVEGKKGWVVTLADGRQVEAQWLLPAVGFSSVLNMPRISGMDHFDGPIYHTARWPHDAMDMSGKRVAVIGTGPSGVQVIQAIGKVAKAMTIYQQTPCLTLRKYAGVESQPHLRKTGLDIEPETLRRGLQSFNGFQYAHRDQDTLTASTEERDHFYRQRYQEGGWAFWMGGFRDLYHDSQANEDAYAFWADQTKARIRNPSKRKLLVPENPSMPFGVKRPCLEEDLYEVMDQSNVEIVDISERPIEAFTREGVLANGRNRAFDAIILATGFADEASGILNLDIHGCDGISLTNAWSSDVQSHLGIAVNGFPNMFYLYGPQCPTLLVNSPAVIAVQVDWVCDVLADCRKKGVGVLEATTEAQVLWQRKMREHWVKSLYYKHTVKVKKGAKAKIKEQTWYVLSTGTLSWPFSED